MAMPQKTARTTESIRFVIVQASIGAVLVAASGQGLCAVLIGDEPLDLERDLRRRFPRAAIVPADAALAALASAVVEYIEEPRGVFDAPLDLRGTPFQRQVWQAVRDIPAGQTASYAEIARRIGQPQASRAVGGACAKNPIGFIIPCHRVIKSDGGLSGYGFGGCGRKAKLLEREARV
jgi:AraC family transcriptional regulator of adaptative response/methylated-DNA-[protein]-cysteine methyltransferase